MRKNLYARLAFGNLKKHAASYLPYCLACVLTVVVFYILASLSSNPQVTAMRGGGTMQYVLSLGEIVVGIFAVVFLFYTYGFIVKRRKKEFGLLNVLGMEKRHIGRMLAFETLYVAVLTIGAGLGVGILLDKLMVLVLAKILRAEYGFGFVVSGKAVLTTAVLFLAVFAVVWLYALLQVKLGKPVDLLKGGEVGEKEPKSRWLLGGLGLFSLLCGYACALGTRDGVAAIEMFFVAVLFVVVGTYLLFTAGSIVLLKSLRKNKKFYYKTHNFIGVSGMMHRMKQNAVGLASICILSTMLLVTVSTTTSFMVGRDEMLLQKYPYDFLLQARATDNAQICDDLHTRLNAVGLHAENEMTVEYLQFNLNFDGERFTAEKGNDPRIVLVVKEKAYTDLTGVTLGLSADEAAVAASGMAYTYSAVDVLGERFTVKETVQPFLADGLLANGMSDALGGLTVVVGDEGFGAIDIAQKAAYGDDAQTVEMAVAFDVTASDEDKKAFYEAWRSALDAQSINARLSCRAAQADAFMSLYGGLFFLGVYLSVLFLVAAALIMYYKQISEGYEDRKRFAVMQKVGLGYREIKRAIGAQILTMFYLPLVFAGLHIACAFPMITRMLGLLTLTDTKLFALCSLACFAAFAVVYVLVYLVSARSYYRILKIR